MEIYIYIIHTKLKMLKTCQEKNIIKKSFFCINLKNKITLNLKQKS